MTIKGHDGLYVDSMAEVDDDKAMSSRVWDCRK